MCSACGGGGSSTSPSGPVTSNDLVGTWVQTDGSRTWILAAGSSIVNQITVIQFGGPATFVQSNHPSFGSMSARGGVQGTILVGLAGLQFAESYDSLSSPLFPFPPNDCYIDTEGQLALSGNTLTGTVTEHDGCNGARLRDSSSRITLQRK
jgi:hypothetical protein